MNDYAPSPVWSDQTKRTVALIILLVSGLAILRLNNILPLLLVAVVLSFLLYPLSNFIEKRALVFGPLRKRSSRGLAVLLTFVVSVLFVVLVFLLILPVFVAQFNDLSDSVPGFIGDTQDFLERELSKPISFRGQPVLLDGEPLVPLDRLPEILGTRNGELVPVDNFDFLSAAQSVFGSFTGVTGKAFGFVGGAFSALINVIFLLTMMGYLLSDGKNIVAKMIEITPTTYQGDVQQLFSELAYVWNAYLRGQLILSVVMGSLVFLAATILGVPNAPVLALLSGLGEFIPNLGALMALVPAVFLALFDKGPEFALLVAVVWTAFQQLSATFLQPRIMGENLNLHPFVIIVAVIAGASLAGALGVILAAPTAASLRVLLQYVYGKMTDKDPFPPRKEVTGVASGAAFKNIWNMVNGRRKPQPSPEAEVVAEEN